jgi:Ca-activated chloride channel family protein
VSLGFDHPERLAAALLVIPFTWVGLRWFAAMAPLRRLSAVVFRTVLVAILAGMLAGVSTIRATDRVAVIGVIDISGSVRRFGDAGRTPDGRRIDPIEAARRFFETAEKHRRPDDLMGLVVFDGRSIAVATPSPGGVTDRAIDVPMAEGTDIAGALRNAAALIPPDAAGRLVLVSDGVETFGEAERAARELSARPMGDSGRVGIPVDVVPVTYAVTGETGIVSMDAPPRAAAGAVVNVRIVLNSTDGSAGTLYLLREGEPVDINGDLPGVGRRLSLGPGSHVEVVSVRLDQSRIHRFRAVYEPDSIDDGRGGTVASGDTLSENNSGEAFTVTPGRGTVLILRGAPEEGSTGTLGQTLRAAGVDVTEASPEGLPRDLLAMQAYDLVILQDVSAESLTDEGQLLLSSFVRELGGGLVMVGGPDSFGAGGWLGSVLEPLIPVKMDLPEKLIQPDAAIMLVLDVSGSMGRTVMGTSSTQQEIANEAAARAVQSLERRDLVGVIAFSDKHWVVCPLRENRDPEAAGAKIRALAPGGGTNIGPALEEAGRQLAGVKASVRHVIVVSDGVSMGRDSLPRIARDLHERHGITVSTISVGDQADDRMMESMALRGGGTFYPVSNPSLLPRFFLKAVRVVRSPLVREAPFDPVVMPTPSPLTAGIENPPKLGGLNLTQWRPEATIVRAMAASTGEPLLAHWQVELGQVAAFTSDADRWAAPWIESGWTGYARLWTQVARAMSRPAGGGRFDLATELDGDRMVVRLDASGLDGRPLDLLTVPTTVYTPSGRTMELTLVQTAPGVYEGRADARESGSYIAVAKPRLGSQRLTPAIGGASVASGVEYRALRSNEALLRRIAEATGGRVLSLGSADSMDLFDRTGVTPSVSRAPLWRSLMIWALLVLMLDVGTRRIAWDRFVSRRFGLGLGASAADAVRDRGEQAARSVERLRRGARLSMWTSGEPLGDADARLLAAREADRRSSQRLAALRSMRDDQEAEPETDRDAANDRADPGTSGLLAAKRRARERFDRAPGGGEDPT